MLDGPINGQSFTAWVEQFLVPTLAPGDVLIMDNPGSHKGAGVRKAIRAAGVKMLFLPPYSPDLNPIEHLPRIEGRTARVTTAIWCRLTRVGERGVVRHGRTGLWPPKFPPPRS